MLYRFKIGNLWLKDVTENTLSVTCNENICLTTRNDEIVYEMLGHFGIGEIASFCTPENKNDEKYLMETQLLCAGPIVSLN